MSKEVAASKRKAPAKDAPPAKKVKSEEKIVEKTNPKLKAAADAKKSRKRAADYIEDEDAAPAVKPVEDSPKQKKVKISKKVEVVEPEPVPTSISKSNKKDKKSKKSEEKALVVAEEEEEIALPADSEDEEDVAALLAGFSSDESEGEEVVDKDGIEVDKVPQPKLDKKAKKALKKAQEAENDPPGTICVSRIPHGFYEPQMRAYFTQFGTILNLRLSRNKKTGASKHYAFIQFSSSEVADIVARTMNNYLMFGHILKVRVMPAEQIHPDLWKNANRRFKVVPRNMLERKSLEGAKGREFWEKKREKETKKRNAKKKAMKEMGYEFEAPELKDVNDVPMKENGVDDAEGETAANGAEELVKAITDATAVVDDVAVEVENLMKDSKKTKKEKTKVKVSKKAKA